ncbi:LacI family DNA-binding transcriptional regulator [Microbacterium esteraromaticum]|uniref:LacI family DNA-binding transcriptional regulator n=1 Tax=Microbacterium esteraromaticum TaxID=57043 RepID=UPI001C93B11F|nr:LacI family DNA-binding transcriptional regulator [Microbacterium esteraromaticum]MBY6062213.1 LacI family transcriptional regulator [Microbacterium esteraromaticum]
MNPATSKRATRKDVAALAGTSESVVSYVVNGGPRSVAPATRKRVLEAIERVGYYPDPTARSLASGVSGVFGIIVPDLSNAFFASLSNAIGEVAHAESKLLLLGDSTAGASREVEIVEEFIRRRVDGLLYVGVERRERIAQAHAAGIPVVVLDRLPNDSPIASVTIDNEAGAFAATEHLLNHGYTDVAIIAGPIGVSTASDRSAGWRRALSSRGVTPKAEWCVPAPFTKQGGRTAGRHLLSETPTPRAVFASNDQQAIGLMVAAGEQGLRIPEDLAIFAFDGTADAEFTTPALSTVSQPLEEIARKAVELLVAPDSPSSRKITCNFSLTIRQSCGCLAFETGIHRTHKEQGVHTSVQEDHTRC